MAQYGYSYKEQFRNRIRTLWPLRHKGRASELRTLITAYRNLV
jgi:hypothetical protein